MKLSELESMSEDIAAASKSLADAVKGEHQETINAAVNKTERALKAVGFNKLVASTVVRDEVRSLRRTLYAAR